MSSLYVVVKERRRKKTLELKYGEEQHTLTQKYLTSVAVFPEDPATRNGKKVVGKQKLAVLFL